MTKSIKFSKLILMSFVTMALLAICASKAPCDNNFEPVPESVQKGILDPIQKSKDLCKQAQIIAETDAAAAEKIYLEAMDVYPKSVFPYSNGTAIMGYAECEEKLKGNAKAALPLFRQALFDPSTLQIRLGIGSCPGEGLFKIALLFEENDSLPDAKKIYNAAIAPINKELSQRASKHKAHTRHGIISLPYTPFLMPEMTEQLTALDLSSNIYLGIFMADGVGFQTTHEARSRLETSLMIKDNKVTRWYLAKYADDLAPAWASEMKENPPSPEFKAKIDEASAAYEPYSNETRFKAFVAESQAYDKQHPTSNSELKQQPAAQPAK